MSADTEGAGPTQTVSPSRFVAEKVTENAAEVASSPRSGGSPAARAKQAVPDGECPQPGKGEIFTLITL